jgi:hypothetical protein
VLATVGGPKIPTLIAHAAGGPLTISKVAPTVLFARANGGVQQVANVTVHNSGLTAVSGVVFRAVLDGAVVETPLGSIAANGDSTQRVQLPDLSAAEAPATFELVQGGSVTASLDQTWHQQRKWTLWVMPTSHDDLLNTADYPYTAEEHARTLDSALALAQANPDYRFQNDDGIQLQQYAQLRSADRLQQLAAAMRSGQIGLDAEYDDTGHARPGGEGLVQSVLGDARERALERRVGVHANAAVPMDVSSIVSQTPQLLHRAGVNYMLFTPLFPCSKSNPTPGGLCPWQGADSLPYLFRWRSPDGSSVLTWRTSVGYDERGYFGSPDAYAQHTATTENAIDQILQDRQAGVFRDATGNVFPGRSVYPYSDYLISWARGGGDNRLADDTPLSFMHQWNSTWAYPQVRLTTASEFLAHMDATAQDVPTVTGEFPLNQPALLLGLPEQYARRAARAVGAAETWTAVADALAGTSTDPQRFDDVYENLAKFQEHNPGALFGPTGEQLTGVDPFPVCQEPVRLGDECPIPEPFLPMLTKVGWARDAESGALTTDQEALGRLAAVVGDREPTVAVFNSAAHARSDVVFLPADQADLASPDLCLVDEASGAAVPYQRLDRDTYHAIAGPHPAMTWYAQQDLSLDRGPASYLAFVAHDVPAVGYRLFGLRRKAECAAAPEGFLTATTAQLVSPRYQVDLDPLTGAVAALHDRSTGAQVVDQTAPQHLGELIDAYRGVSAEPGVTRVIASGPVLASVVTTAQLADVTRNLAVTVFAGLDRVDLTDVADVPRVDPGPRALSMAFPLTGSSGRYESVFGDHVLGGADLAHTVGGPGVSPLGTQSNLAQRFQATGDSGQPTVTVSSPDTGFFTTGTPYPNDRTDVAGVKPWFYPILVDSPIGAEADYKEAQQGLYVDRFSVTTSEAAADYGDGLQQALEPVLLAPRVPASAPLRSFLDLSAGSLATLQPASVTGASGTAVLRVVAPSGGGATELHWAAALGRNARPVLLDGSPDPAAVDLTVSCRRGLCETTLSLAPAEVVTLALRP